MDPDLTAWFSRSSHVWSRWSQADLLERKQRLGCRISVVVPARDEVATVGDVVGALRRELVDAVPLVDELVVIDSDSTDGTARVAAAAGATVHAARDVLAGEPSHPGKGEAMWKSLFVTTGDLLVFVDADLTVWGPHFVTGLLGPLLEDPATQLVKGFYDRLLDGGDLSHDDGTAFEGGRVTELVARPLISLRWPELGGVVQPLAGEWAARRSLLERLSLPTGYGVELAVLVDTWRAHGLDAVAQVDLGRRAHRHQPLRDLGTMAVELMAVAETRADPPRPLPDVVPMWQFGSGTERGRPGRRLVSLDQRAPALDHPAYRAAR